MKWLGIATSALLFHFLLPVCTCSILPFHTPPLPPVSSMQAAIPHSSLHTAPYQPHYTFHPTSHHPHLHLHTAVHRSSSLLHPVRHSSFPMAQAQKLPSRTTYLPSRYSQNTHHQSGTIRGKRQSPAPSVLFPVALEGAAPPSQYPWAIVWGPTVSGEEAAFSSDSSTPHSSYQQEGSSHEYKEPARGLDLRGAPTTLRPPIYPPTGEETDPQLYVTIVISVLIVLAATGIIIKFCCERRQRRRQHHSDRCPLPEEGSLQPLTDLSPDADISGLHPIKPGDSKTGADIRVGPCRTSNLYFNHKSHLQPVENKKGFLMCCPQLQEDMWGLQEKQFKEYLW